ncbi:MerR family transcriptional regulator [Haematospirillum sp. 15-248]|uniref:MerR family transcriptional regulator n=1 Tax=Haematospirillum sp. 15-248 TaxID=2723107 RepID=UPI0014389E1C|nr:MerR family transcriptional regulator [Haematospirillum sp. 15-248]NKD87030.1 MerR family transcriptional regulator [Haematospirillum sp. 15-248]
MQSRKEKQPVKSENAFRTIGEVSEDLGVPQHVLRFWETQFSQIKPLKRGGGRRYYRPEDIALLVDIRSCLYDQGYTIRGVQKLLCTKQNALECRVTPTSGQDIDSQDEVSISQGLTGEQRRELESVLAELEDVRAFLGIPEFA